MWIFVIALASIQNINKTFKFYTQKIGPVGKLCNFIIKFAYERRSLDKLQSYRENAKEKKIQVLH